MSSKIIMYSIERYNDSYRDSLLKIFWQHVPAFFAEHEEKDLILFLDNHAQDFFVCKDGDKVIGCGGHNFDGEDTGVLSWYMTDAGYMGKGVGAMLVQYNLERLREHEHIKRIRVRTSQLTDKFYEKFGFQLMFTKDDYWGKGLHLYQMEMDA